MADERLIFPIGFDLQSGVKKVADDWPSHYKTLQKIVDKTPLKIKLKIDSKGLDLKGLSEYNKLTREAALAAKRAADVEGKRALARQRQSAARVAEATEEARIAKIKAQSEMTQLRLNDAQKNGIRHANALNNAYKKQGSYLQRLVQRMSVYFGVYQFIGILKNIRETTAEFELQKVALGALIQDAHKAEVLFSQIKAAAVESPYQIKELVNYTKQLAAYGFEQETLFDTTMKLADISAGLGADMSRIILAIGQISAASVLKGTELRQLTELGIPMVELLAKKFTQLRGEIVSTGEVFEMISDKAVSFKMVEEILNDLTSAGGMFYDMQRKQAETLAGQWSNLKDTVSIAYEEIGNTDTVREVMEGWISTIKSLAENWNFVINSLMGAAIAVGVVKSLNGILSLYTAKTNLATTASARYTASLRGLVVAKRGGWFISMLANQSVMYARHMKKAALATNIFTKGWHRLLAVVKGNWITIAIAAVAALISYIVSATQKANELNNELAEIGQEGASKMAQSVRNFERLAKIAVESADGTKRQTDALNELNRTYGDIIPSQDLEIDRLRQMKDGYEDITSAIREKIAMQTLEQKVSTIRESYGQAITENQKAFKNYLEKTVGLSDDEALRVITNIQKQISDGVLSINTDMATALKKAISEEVLGEKDFDPMGIRFKGFWNGQMLLDEDVDEAYKNFIRINGDMENAIKQVTKEMESQTGTLGKYTEMWNSTSTQIQTDIGEITVPKGTKLYEENIEKAKIKNYIKFLRETIGFEMRKIHFFSDSPEVKEKYDIDKYIVGNTIDFDELLNLDNISVQARNAVRKVQEALQGFTGWKETIQGFSKDITIDGITRKMFLYTDEEINNMGSLQSTLEDVAKKWKEYNTSIDRYGKALKGTINPEEKKQIEYKKAQSEEWQRQAYEILKYYNSLDLIAEKGTGKNDEDEWIVLMKNRAAFMKDFQKGVEDLSKKQLKAEALLTQRKIMRTRGLSLDYDVDTLTGSSEELVDWYDKQIEEVVKKIRGLGAKEGFEELSVSAILHKDTKNRMVKAYQDLLQWLFNQKTDFQTNQTEQSIKETINQLSKNIARSKEAQNFYDDILGMTGNKQLSADLTMNIYGGIGDDLQNNVKKQLEKVFDGVDISSAFDGDNVNYNKLSTFVNKLPKDMQANAWKIIDEGIKDNAKWVKDLYKTYEDFKTYEERRTTILERESQKRKEIEANAFLTPEQKKSQIEASYKREAQEITTIDLEEFKASEDWIKTFENIDKVGTKSIEHLMGVLDEFIKTNKDLTPEQLKTLMSEYEKLYQGLIARNPLKAISQGTKEYFKSTKDLRSSKNEVKQAKKEERIAATDIQIAQNDLKSASNDYERAAATTALFKAEERLTKAINKRQKAEKKVRKAEDRQIESLHEIKSGVEQSGAAYNALRDIVDGVMDTFGVDETSELGIALKSVSEALTMVAGVLGIINAMITLIESHPLVIAISAGIMAIIGAIMLFKNLKTADAEAKIEKMSKKIEELEYAYERLEKAQEKAFGADYITNYKQRLSNLLDTQNAYLAQAEAERGKGKEADEEKIKEYEDSARETADNITDMGTEISEHFLGSDITSAARDFAQAWIDAYKEFGSTTDAINENFSEMIENMIVESLAAKVIQGHIEDIFDAVESLSEDGQISVSDAAQIANLTKLATENIDVGMNNLMNALSNAGLSVRGMGTDLTGISKDIATASEESILGLASGINTQNFYISQIPPKIDTIIAILQGGASPVGGVNVQDLITIQNQHLSHLPNIATNTLNTVDRCERAAVACESVLEKIGSVISVKGTSATHVVNIN